MQEKPSIQNKKAVHLSFLLIVFSVFAFAMAKLAGPAAFLVQASAFLAAAVGISILIRYVLTDYLYTLEDRHFTIHKINGKKSVWVADITLSDILTTPMTPEQYRKYLADTGKKMRVCAYIKNMDSGHEYYLPCCLNGTDYALRLELTEPFLSALTEAIQTTAAREEKEPDEDEFE